MRSHCPGALRRVPPATAVLLGLAAWVPLTLSAQDDVAATPPASGSEPAAAAPAAPASGEPPSDAAPATAAPASAEAPASASAPGGAPSAAAPTAEGAAPPPRAATGTEPPPPPAYAELNVPPADDAVEGEWDPWENPEAGHRHEGFFLRLSFGFGFGSIGGGDALSTGTAVDFSGGAAGGSFAIGGTIAGALSLHVDFFFSRLLNPAVERGRRDYDYGDPGIGAAGLGATYHFANNVYVGLSGGLASVNWERQTGEVSESEAGLGGHAIVGKEWWVDPDWGVGIAVQAIMAEAADPFYETVSVQAYHLLLSATYN